MSSAPYEQINKLLKFFQDHPNRTFTHQQVEELTGIPKGSISGATRVIQKGNPQLTRPSRGMYRWVQAKAASTLTPTKATSTLPLDELEAPFLGLRPQPPVVHHSSSAYPEKLSVIGPTSGGELIAQSDAGELYSARKL